jgi:hypothetical protein
MREILKWFLPPVYENGEEEIRLSVSVLPVRQILFKSTFVSESNRDFIAPVQFRCELTTPFIFALSLVHGSEIRSQSRQLFS